ncbi:hypothetical protein [Streptomonospora alba]|uniref:hypothetical protein n=1 Tax=Streptomonospora alba TaxID=183763 RepID=UPI0012EEDA45|nr:hypothetical protein [Streptomonospora alba]
MGHAFVPWRERHDRPAYVVTQAVVNIGTLGVGAALKLGKLPQLHGDAPGPNALPDLVDRVPDAANPSRPGTSDLPSAADLRNRLDELETAVNDDYSPVGAMDAVDDIPLREHAVSGVPGTQVNGDGPEGTDSPPSTTPAPNPSAATDGPSVPAGDGGGPGSSTPPNAGGSGGQPPSSQGEGGRVGGEGPEESDRPEPPPRSGQQQPPQDGPEGTPGDDQPVDKPSVSPAPSDLPGDAGPSGTPADDRSSSGAGEASSGIDHGEQVPRQTDQLSEAELEKRLQKANIVEQKLRDGGLTNDEISQLFGEHPRHGDQWQRAHSALNQSFNKKVNAELHPEAVRFAFQGADNPREFAYRYEYLKAIYDEQVDHAKNLGPETHPGASRNIAALERFRDIDVHAQLRDDHARVSEVWGSDPARVDPSSSQQEIDQALRDSADKIGMGHPTSASYHAHKHFKELPLDEQSDDKIYSYHQSASQTIRTGDIVEYERNEDGSIELAYQRTTYDGLGNPLGTLKGRIVVRPDGLPIMKTYMGSSR